MTEITKEVEFVRGAGVKLELDGYANLAEAQGVARSSSRYMSSWAT
jgi:hypothetical protein